jgi:hypothetical protein
MHHHACDNAELIELGRTRNDHAHVAIGVSRFEIKHLNVPISPPQIKVGTLIVPATIFWSRSCRKCPVESLL